MSENITRDFVEVIPDSNIVNWNEYDRKFICAVESESVLVLLSEFPKMEANSIDSGDAEELYIRGSGGETTACWVNVHLRPNKKQLQDIHKSIGLLQGEPA